MHLIRSLWRSSENSFTQHNTDMTLLSRNDCRDLNRGMFISLTPLACLKKGQLHAVFCLLCMSSTLSYSKKRLEIRSAILPNCIVKYVNECLQGRVKWDTQQTKQGKSCNLPKIYVKLVVESQSCLQNSPLATPGLRQNGFLPMST